MSPEPRSSAAAPGLYYYRARYYDPNGGRFISEDPIGFLGGMNFYVYVDNSPSSFLDPTGNKVTIDPNTQIGKRLASMTPLERQLSLLDFMAPLSVVESTGAKAAAEFVKFNEHHVFPQAKEFEAFFRQAGIDIHDYLVKIPQEWHQQWVHALEGRGRAMERRLEEVLRRTPQRLGQGDLGAASAADRGSRLLPEEVEHALL
jgi:RHS repeat-associated protein